MGSSTIGPLAWGSLAVVPLTLALTGCGREGSRERPDASAGPDATKDARAQVDGAEAPDDGSPWRFVPTLEQHLPAGAVAEPVLELSQPRQRTVVVVAAVLRSGSPHVELERWTFAQSPDGESLLLQEGGEALVRLRSGPRNSKLGELRRALAAPRVVLTRPLGLDAAEPRSALDELAAAVATTRDPEAEPRARVKAAATVVRGLDDTVVFERDAIAALAERLDPPPSAVQVQSLSDRRARATLEHPAGSATLELQRKADGWAVASVELAEPPAAPEPVDASRGTPPSP